MKFGRTYTANIQGFSRDVDIAYPISLYFNVSRGVLQSANNGTFRFYNLGKDTRAQIFHDRWDTTTYRRISVHAGYESQTRLPLIFRGNITSAYSYKQGTDWITEIEALDGGFGIINGNASTTSPSTQAFKDTLKALIRTMPNIVAGAIGNFSSNKSRGTTYAGNAWDIINRITEGAQNFIDNETANILKFDEYIDQDGVLPTINLDSGLLGTPRRSEGRIDVTLMFEPGVILGQKIELNSLETVYNGEYIIKGITHRAVISPTVGGDAVTVLNFTQSQALVAVRPQ